MRSINASRFTFIKTSADQMRYAIKVIVMIAAQMRGTRVLRTYFLKGQSDFFLKQLLHVLTFKEG